jgi:hypothetical protein
MTPWPATLSNSPDSPKTRYASPGSKESSQKRPSGDDSSRGGASGDAEGVFRAIRRITRSTAQSLPRQINATSRSDKKQSRDRSISHEKIHSGSIGQVVEFIGEHHGSSPANDNASCSKSSPLSESMILSATVSPVEAKHGESEYAICSSTELGDHPQRHSGRALCSSCCDAAEERLKAKTVGGLERVLRRYKVPADHFPICV